MGYVLLFFLIGVAAADFTGHRLVSINARSREDLDFLNALGENPDFEGLDFWTDLSVYRPVEVRVSPNDYEKLQQTLKSVGISFDVINENIQDMIDEERRSMEKIPKVGLCNPQTTYCTYDEIGAWLSSMASSNPYRMQFTYLDGLSYEGREIYQVKIAGDMYNPKEAVWIEAGTHAREWIAISSALNLIEKLLSNSNEATEMLSKYDWYIVPVHNPDGYLYTHASSNNRLWRKNRQPCNMFYTGTDLNRNWEANFGGPGSSSSCFSETYRGTTAFSAPETAALRDAVLATPLVKAFFSVHCYSEYMLVPYGYTSAYPGRYDHLMDVANYMMMWLETIDERYYLTGTPPDILYEASGGAYDYFYTQDIPYSYTYELRPKSGTSNGFVLPASEIPLAADELFISLWAFSNITNLNWDMEPSHP
ncbi:zinc carboxypeptidase-like [Mercenaria mercenaria]|uniref:zinc carboxypeptidase-like n=1 Tax=Mercenaria mercenaria TaxID=6596 RepID=UPI00234F2194|nr:zinc carboxypeptidase-like [Mercenaria mercenaria]